MTQDRRACLRLRWPRITEKPPTPLPSQQAAESEAEEMGKREECCHSHRGGLNSRAEEKHFMSEFYQLFEEHIILPSFKLFESIKS